MLTVNNPLVSILIPLYNSEKYIAETIQSCLDQTWQNIGIIIVDDGSKDKSLEIAKSFTNPKVKVFEQENQGACVARNKAFELSKGEFIQYLDSDDLLSPNKIENQLKLFAKYGDKIVTSCQWDRFYEKTDEASFPFRVTYKDYDSGLDWIVDSIEKRDMNANSAWLAHRKVIEKAGKWDENLTINQDGEFFARVLLNSEGVRFCNDAFVYYRSGDQTRITYTTNKRAESRLNSYISIEENILKKENSERTRHACYLNYLKFIYEHYEQAPEQVNKAKQRIKSLGYKKLEPYGGENFKKIAKIIGFETTLKLRSLLKKK